MVMSSMLLLKAAAERPSSSSRRRRWPASSSAFCGMASGTSPMPAWGDSVRATRKSGTRSRARVDTAAKSLYVAKPCLSRAASTSSIAASTSAQRRCLNAKFPLRTISFSCRPHAGAARRLSLDLSSRVVTRCFSGCGSAHLGFGCQPTGSTTVMFSIAFSWQLSTWMTSPPTSTSTAHFLHFPCLQSALPASSAFSSTVRMVQPA
mmetsp:Transcript_9903/g.26407  ORF Transcript_9903/g.26407 Transcript_9903/m.26407 type:complete len:206 (+) Transcript_9903:319-936(+)